MENNNENKETPNANAEAQKPNAEQPNDTPQTPAAPKAKKPFYKNGWFWGACAVVGGIIGVGAALWLNKEDVEEAAETATDAVDAVTE